MEWLGSGTMGRAGPRLNLVHGKRCGSPGCKPLVVRQDCPSPDGYVGGPKSGQSSDIVPLCEEVFVPVRSVLGLA